MICPECNKNKPFKHFCGKDNVLKFETCRDCRLTPLAEKVSRAEIVKASSISRVSGTYVPPAWDIRKGSDAFLRVPSRRFT
jgi:hypothetical protein